jgi:hypothetical protein
LWIHEPDKEGKNMTAHVDFRPTGRAQVIVKLPKNFWDALMGAAQTAADHQEALMRAEILADNTEQKDEATVQPTNNTGANNG